MRKLFCNQLHFLPQKKFLTTKKISYHKKKILTTKKNSYHKKIFLTTKKYKKKIKQKIIHMDLRLENSICTKGLLQIPLLE